MKTDISIQDQSFSLDISSDEMDKVGGFLNQLVPGFMKDGVGLLNDQIKFWRRKRGIYLMQQAQEIIQSRGLSIHSIEPKLLIPIIENSSLESDDSIHQKRVNMLVNASTGQKKVFVSYTSILNELGSTEVFLLDRLYEEGSGLNSKEGSNITEIQFSTEKVSKSIGISLRDAKLIVEILFRLRLAEAPSVRGISMGGLNPVGKTNEVFQLTELGIAFIEACKI